MGILFGECLITWFVIRLTRRVPLVEHKSSTTDFSGVRVTRSLVICLCFVDRCLSFCTISFGHCNVCYSSIFGFWLPFGIFKLFSILFVDFKTNRRIASSKKSWMFRQYPHLFSSSQKVATPLVQPFTHFYRTFEYVGTCFRSENARDICRWALINQLSIFWYMSAYL